MIFFLANSTLTESFHYLDDFRETAGFASTAKFENLDYSEKFRILKILLQIFINWSLIRKK